MHLGSSNTTKATSDSLSLISQVTGFEIVELWASFKGGPIQCVFVYATCKTLLSYPHIVPGHYPERTTDEHSISLKVFDYIKMLVSPFCTDTNRPGVLSYYIPNINVIHKLYSLSFCT